MYLRAPTRVVTKKPVCAQMTRVAVAAVASLAFTIGAAPAVADAASTQVLCVQSNSLIYKTRPTTCDFNPAGADVEANYGNFWITKLRWRGWGNTTTRASGIERSDSGTDTANVRTRVSVRLSRRERCGDRFIYRRVTIVRESGRLPSSRFLTLGCLGTGGD